MSEPVRVQLSRAKGWRIPENTVVVSRPSKWGNLFIVGHDGKREDCARYFAWMLNGTFLVAGTPSFDEMRAYRKFASKNLWRLKGKNLACWCRLPKDGGMDHCHAAVLLHIANRPAAALSLDVTGSPRDGTTPKNPPLPGPKP